MNLSQQPDALKKFRARQWKFQATFVTPLKDLPRFVAVIVSAMPEPASGQVTIDQWVFEPDQWIKLLKNYSIEPNYARGSSVTATGKEEVEALLRASFSGWLDFIFVPTPSPFVIYADHDEYATFFAQSRSNLNRVVQPVASTGAKSVADYLRKL